MNTTTAIDPKLAVGAGVGPSLAFVLWTVLYMLVDRVHDFAQDDPLVFGSLILATGAVFGGVLGYFTRNAASPIPGDGASIERSLEELPPPPRDVAV